MYGFIGNIVNLKQYGKYVGAVLLCVSLFFVGRYTAPEKVVEVAKSTEVSAKNDSSAYQKSDTKTVYQTVEKPVDRVITKVVVREPDGKTTETTTDATHHGNTVTTGAVENKNETRVQIKTEYVYVDKMVEKTVTKLTNPKWAINAGVGYNLPRRIDVNYVPGLPEHTYVTAGVTRYLGENFGVTAQATSRGDIGAAIEFRW